MSGDRLSAKVLIILMAFCVLAFCGCKDKSDPVPPGPTLTLPDKVANPGPADGATGVSVTTTLSWDAAAGATSYDVYFGTDETAVTNADTSSPEFMGNQTGLTFDPGTLSYSTTYYWRVDSVNADGVTTGDVWSFTTEADPSSPPDQVANPDPPDSAVDVPVTTDLSWGAAAGADSYDVYFGTDQAAVAAANTSSPEFMGNFTDLSYDPGTLDYSTTYYWRIDSVNTIGTTTGNVWSFTTEDAPVVSPDQVTNPDPPDGAVDVPLTVDMSWDAATGATSYDVYFGTDETAVTNADTSSPEFMGNQTDLSYDPGVLDVSTTYYWRIDSVNAAGTTTGPVWSFTTEDTPSLPPEQVTNPDPPDGAVDVPLTVDMSWDAATGATSYDVYFGTDETAVTDADTSTSGIYKGNQTELTYNPGILDNATTYYWRIDSVNTAGTTKGDTWSFTTGDEPPTCGDLFGQPIQTDEIIFVIDRTGSMNKPATITIEDENGNPVVNPLKIEVARIGTVKSIMGLDEDAKFAIVGFSTGANTSMTIDPNWATGGGGPGGHWSAWPPAQGEPAPIGRHYTCLNNLPVWPTTKKLVWASAENKASAIAWCNQRFTGAEVSGGTCTYEGMSCALKMVIPPPPSPGTSNTCVYLMTDGAPTFISGVAYSLGASPNTDATWVQQCMDLTKAKILAEDIHQAKIFTAGLGMDSACPNAYVWDPGKMDWDFYPTEYNDRCRQFLTDLAEAVGGTYNEICP